MTTSRLGATIALPAAPGGWFDYDYVVLFDGRLAILRTDWDYRAAQRRWVAAFQSNDTSVPMPSMAGRHLQVSVFDGRTDEIRFVIESPNFPVLHMLADGRWMLAEGRAEPRSHNGRLLAASGRETARFIAGDGIQDVACAPDGSFWISYFDEGIFGGDQGPDGRWPISSAGLAHFTPAGAPDWRFNDDQQGHRVDDCYALTLKGNAVWLCPYMDFPIIRVENGRTQSWRNEVNGARAIAVSGDHVLLAGGYGQDTDRIVLLRLEDDHAVKVGETRLPLIDRYAMRREVGVNGVLHVIQEGQWTRIGVADAIARFSN
jgi:hypothetical protein